MHEENPIPPGPAPPRPRQKKEKQVDYFEVLTEPDECAKHGKKWMIKTPMKGGGVSIDGELVKEGTDPVCICMQCILVQFESGSIELSDEAQDRIEAFQKMLDSTANVTAKDLMMVLKG